MEYGGLEGVCGKVSGDILGVCLTCVCYNLFANAKSCAKTCTDALMASTSRQNLKHQSCLRAVQDRMWNGRFVSDVEVSYHKTHPSLQYKHGPQSPLNIDSKVEIA